VRIEREDLLRLDSSLGRMWLETDGVGGFAASTSLLCATSRYHGLLLAPPRGTAKRHLFLSRFEETLVAPDGREFPLSTVRWRGATDPEGHRYLETFEPTPFPSWLFRLGDVELRREMLLAQGAPTALVRWRLGGGATPLVLRLRPFLACREADALTYENVYLVRTVHPIPGGVAARPYASLPTVSMTSGGRATFVAEPAWYRGVEFSDDLARGYSGHEDQFTPGRFEVELAPGEDVVLAVTTATRVDAPTAAWRAAARARRAASVAEPSFRATLERAAEQFLHRTPEGRVGVIAGFPWFGEWGRDTCISLPGLLLPRGKVAECGDALAGLAGFLRRGRLPNRFGTSPETSEYAASDPALWFARAVRYWEKAGGDEARLLDEFLPVLVDVARELREGRADDLSIDDGGLLVAKSGKTAATWMDAVLGGVAVTPRDGCAVEVNALWCFLLEYVARLLKRAGRDAPARDWKGISRRAGKLFLRRFWLEDAALLADAWDDGAVDRRVRPNMVIAASLEFSPLDKTQRAAVVDAARRELLTPRGLRTLSPRDPDYRGRYEGDVRSRDAAYHQGTAWPWLVGPYAEAHLRAHGRGVAARRHVREVVEAFAPHLEEGCLGQVAEVFDGDPPHRPGGAWAQAWSVAELLRACALAGPTG
jgi:predicted glycogen debranching enzyme